MARTGFYDRSQDLYLPKDSNTWADLTGGWDTYTGWYQNLSSSTELEFTSDIIDFGYQHNIFPVIKITVRRDGSPLTGAVFGTGFPEFIIEGSNNSDMSAATSVTVDKDSTPEYTGVGAKRYYRVTVKINSGINTAPQGLKGIEIALLTDAIEETIESFNTSTVDDGSTAIRTIPTQNTYSSISYVGITAKSEITDTVVTGVSSDGSSVILYVVAGYVTTGYFVGDTGSSSATFSNIQIVPLTRLVSTSTNSFDIQIYKPNTAVETDSVIDAYIRGTPPVAVDVNGNLVRSA
jgi:hypothetical protein